MKKLTWKLDKQNLGTLQDSVYSAWQCSSSQCESCCPKPACSQFPCWAVVFLAGRGLMADQSLALQLRGEHTHTEPAVASQIWVCMINRAWSFRKISPKHGSPNRFLIWQKWEHFLFSLWECVPCLSQFSLTLHSFQHNTNFLCLCAHIHQMKSFVNAFHKPAVRWRGFSQSLILFFCFVWWRKLLKMQLHTIKEGESLSREKADLKTTIGKSFWLDSCNLHSARLGCF